MICSIISSFKHARQTHYVAPFKAKHFFSRKTEVTSGARTSPADLTKNNSSFTSVAGIQKTKQKEKIVNNVLNASVLRHLYMMQNRLLIRACPLYQ